MGECWLWDIREWLVECKPSCVEWLNEEGVKCEAVNV